jgi:hypothetical protein
MRRLTLSIPADGGRLGYVGLSIWDVSSEKKLPRGLPIEFIINSRQSDPTYTDMFMYYMYTKVSFIFCDLLLRKTRIRLLEKITCLCYVP